MTARPQHYTIGPRPTAVLLHLLHHPEVVTYGDLMDHTGLNRSALHEALTSLRAAGLVTWDPGRTGTLRPTLAIVLPTATPQA